MNKMDDLYVPQKLEKCCLIQALEYLGLGWIPYSMEDEYIIDRKRFNPSGYVDSMSENSQRSPEEIKYWEKIEKGCAILQKAIKIGKITCFYCKLCFDENSPIQKVELTDEYHIESIDFCECVLYFYEKPYKAVLFDTADIEKLLKQKISDEKNSPTYRNKLVREIAKELGTQKNYMELELHNEINKRLLEQGYKKYSPRRLRGILKPLNLPLVKRPRGRPKKEKNQ